MKDIVCPHKTEIDEMMFLKGTILRINLNRLGLYVGQPVMLDIITNNISDILTRIDNRLFVNMSEKDIELLYFTLIKNDLINVYTEYPCNEGYADVYIFGRVKPLKYNILIEI